ncbi:MAG: DnaD domain protein [Bacteroidales bacterium]|nr:DnaD domain protein [Bacteroidales bacterium]
MAFVSTERKLKDKSFTSIENNFITNYMKYLPGDTVKVYIYALYVAKNGNSADTLDDMAASLEMDREYVEKQFEDLKTYDLVEITSRSPFEIEILDCENVYGKLRKHNEEKYAGFYTAVQKILKSRSVMPGETNDYIYLMDEYGIDTQAMIKIIGYCATLKDDSIGYRYINTVIRSFIREGCVTERRVSEKLDAYRNATPAIIRIFNECGIKRKPDIDDENFYKKWTSEMGFNEKAIIAAGKLYKSKSVERIDEALTELYNNKKFDPVEMKAFYSARDEIYKATLKIAKNLGVYIQTPEPYVNNYVGKWYDAGYTLDTLVLISNRCFLVGKNRFDDMNAFIDELLKEGVVDKGDVEDYIIKEREVDDFLKSVLSACGLSRNVIKADRDALTLWQSWGFDREMILNAANLSAGKGKPFAYLNSVLSKWKTEGIMSTAAYESSKSAGNSGNAGWDKSSIEKHYSELRHAAEDKAEKVEKICMADPEFRDVSSKTSSLTRKLAFAEVNGDAAADDMNAELKMLDAKKEEILSRLGYTGADLVPQYSCKLCGDTGYDEKGRPCKCMKRLIGEN